MKKLLIGLMVVMALALTVWATSGKVGYGIVSAFSGTQYMNDDSVVTRTMNMRFYKIDENANGHTYTCYQGGSGIKLIIDTYTVGTVTTNDKTFDTWDNRLTATYIPCNDFQ